MNTVNKLLSKWAQVFDIFDLQNIRAVLLTTASAITLIILIICAAFGPTTATTTTLVRTVSECGTQSCSYYAFDRQQLVKISLLESFHLKPNNPICITQRPLEKPPLSTGRCRS